MLALSLKNFRRLVDTGAIQFEPGMTIITGPNGAGKTTLSEAIGYALFGPQSGRGGSGIKSDNAIGDIEVYCSLQIDGHEVEIRRCGNLAELRLDGTLQVPDLAGSGSQVTRQVGVLLGGLTRKQFLHIYVAEQGATAGLVAAERDVRRETLDVALQIDVLRDATKFQKGASDRALAGLRERASATADTLHLTADDRRPLDRFKVAKASTTRGQYLGAVLTRAQAAVERIRGEADARRHEYEAARVEAESALAGVIKAKDAIGRLEDHLKQHETLLKAHQAYVEPIARAEARRQSAKAGVDKKLIAIAQAEACADASWSYACATATLTLTQRRQDRLVAVQARWDGFEQAIRQRHRMQYMITALGDPEAELKAAVEVEERARIRCEELESDPTLDDDRALDRRKHALDEREEQASTALASLHGSEGPLECPTCAQPLQGHVLTERLQHLRRWIENELPVARRLLTRDVAALQTRKQRWIRDRRQAQDALRDASKSVDKIRQRISELKSRRNELSELEARVYTARSAWRELDEPRRWQPEDSAQIKQLVQRLRRRANLLSEKAEQFKALPRLTSELQDEEQKLGAAVKELNGLHEEQDGVGYSSAAHQSIKDQLDDARSECDKLADNVRDKDGMANQLLIRLNDAIGAVTRGESANEELLRSATTYRLEERLDSLLDGFYKHFFMSSTEGVAKRASDFIAQAVTDGTIQGVQFGSDYELLYLDSSHVPLPVSRLSGGEKALVGMCVRLALAEQALQITPNGKLNFLILDEVLSALDDERMEAMQRVLDEVQRHGTFKHVLMITHLEAVKDGWPGARLEVQKLDGKTSRIVTQGSAEPLEVSPDVQEMLIWQEVPIEAINA